jgi:hypothetical protein
MQTHALTERAAYDSTTDLLSDERVDCWSEPPGIDDALTRQTALVTFDQGFRQFPGLPLELPTTAPAASSNPQTPSH